LQNRVGHSPRSGRAGYVVGRCGGALAEPGLTLGIADHHAPTRGRDRAIADPEIAAMRRPAQP
jgi:hypothetical protein